jgi:hypothetical protein
MLLILIPLAWLAVVAMLVILCRAAARADAPSAATANYLGAVGERLVLGERPSAPRLNGRLSFPQATHRRQAAPRLTPRRPAPRRRRIASHGIH